MSDPERLAPRAPHPRARRFAPRRLVPTLALAAACALPASALGTAAERFRPAPGTTILDDGGARGTHLGRAYGLRYEVIGGYAVAEGDIVLGRIGPDGRLAVPLRRRGLGLSGPFARWPDGIVPYRLAADLTTIQRRNIEAAIAHVNERTRVELIPADAPAASGYDDHVLFVPSAGCASFVGRQTFSDEQSLWVADSCSIGSVVHEIGHAIGLFHEHTRPDRDNFITVDWTRVAESATHNFIIYDQGVEMYGEYDYGSIMHYGERFFSRDGEPTIIAPPGVSIGQRLGLSAEDVRSIDSMYATDLMLAATAHASERGIEVDVAVTNVGELGARRLELRVRDGDDTIWRSISTDSGWSCLADETELRCTRERLPARADSRFTILADAATLDADALTLSLEARTLDTDPANNVVGGRAAEASTATAPDTGPPPWGSASGEVPGGAAGAPEAAGGGSDERSDGGFDRGADPTLGGALGREIDVVGTEAAPSLGGTPSADAVTGGAGGPLLMLAAALTLAGRRAGARDRARRGDECR